MSEQLGQGSMTSPDAGQPPLERQRDLRCTGYIAEDLGGDWTSKAAIVCEAA